jgi:hypothetical protein
MFRSKVDRERERYYLLPGMGGRAFRRKQRFFLLWAVITAMGASAMLAALLYWLNQLNLF